jgi:hypothetical protein
VRATVIEVNVRTTVTAILALGLMTMAIGAPGAAAETDAKDPGPCMQVYLFELTVGPVTVDASDSCPEVHVDEPSTTQEPDEICLYPFGC